MAKIVFTHNTNAIIKAKYVEKKTFKWLAVTQSITLILLGICIYLLIK